MRSPYFYSFKRTARRPQATSMPVTVPAFPKTFIIRDVMTETIRKGNIRQQVAELLEGYCQLMETFVATLKNPKISIEEKMLYLEEVYGKKHLKSLLKVYQSSGVQSDVAKLLMPVLSLSKDPRQSLINSIATEASKLPDNFRIDQLKKTKDQKKNIDYYDYDQLYVTIKALLNGRAKSAADRESVLHFKDPHSEFYKEVLEEAYKITRPYCNEMDKFFSRYLKVITFTPPSTFDELDKSFVNLDKVLKSLKLQKLIPVFTIQFGNIFQKLETELKDSEEEFKLISEVIDDLVLRYNVYFEAIELKKILNRFIKSLEECTLNPDEDAQQVFLELLNAMIESIIAHSSKLQGTPDKKYKSRLPSEKEWDVFLKKIKSMKLTPHFAKQVLEETYENKVMDLMDSLTISSENEEDEGDIVDVLVSSSSSSSSSSSASSNSSSNPNLSSELSTYQQKKSTVSKVRVEKEVDVPYIVLMKQRLAHSKKASVYATLFDTSAICTLTWKDLTKCIVNFGGSIDMSGATTGSGSKVMLPLMLTKADELKPSKMKAVCFFHWPHGKRSINDVVSRGILEEFKAGFIAAGLTPDKFGIEFAGYIPSPEAKRVGEGAQRADEGKVKKNKRR